MIEGAMRDTAGLPPGVQHKYFSTWQRAARACVVLVPLLITAALLIANHPGDGGWRFAGILTAMAAFAAGYFVWMKRSAIVLCFDVYVIPRTEKLNKIYMSLGYTFWGLVAIVALVYSGSSNKFQDSVIFIGLLLLLECSYVAAVMARKHREVPPGKADVVGPQMGVASPRPKIPGIDGFPWYFRYPAAVFLIYIGYQVAEQPNQVAPSLILIGIGVCMMYEILAGIVICALVYWFFGALAAVPTSVAVLIGAYWIAESNKKKG